MEMTARPRFRFQYSLRMLFALTTVVALLLVPVVWVARERQQVLLAREAALRAVVLAERDRAAMVQAQLRAAVRAQTGSALSPAENGGVSGEKSSKNFAREAERTAGTPSAEVEQLMRENAELKKTVEELHREIDRLKAMNVHVHKSLRGMP
jgi:hypothetical protein